MNTIIILAVVSILLFVLFLIFAFVGILKKNLRMFIASIALLLVGIGVAIFVGIKLAYKSYNSITSVKSS